MEEYIEYNKIYAHADESGKVTDIFSEAFKTPTVNDVCINATNTDRHGAQRYQVYDEHGIANYALVNGILVKRDKTAELTKTRNVERISEIKRKLSETDYQAIKYAEGFICEADYAPIKAQRQAWRDEINALEAELNIK